MLESRLKEILDERGLKYGFVAKKANITNATMTNLIKGSIPTLPVAYRIARTLEMKLEDIWIEEEVE